ncbi:uncharacterized protein LOC128227567 isoform X2 [Mya arenaria]|nr:uncharacterized protein LOC128227567 isoform X2 [Mya arenaria]
MLSSLETSPDPIGSPEECSSSESMIQNSPRDSHNMSRRSRKQGEKLRREKLNSLVSQLAEEIPMVKHAHRRLDKSAILRLTVNFMKLNLGLKQKLSRTHTIHEIGLLSWIKRVTRNTMFIISSCGTILYVSPKVLDITGFHQTDMIGFHIDKFVHPEDVEVLMGQFVNGPKSPVFTAMFKSDGENTLPEYLEQLEGEGNCFFVRFLQSLKKKQRLEGAPEYETMMAHTHCEQHSYLNTENELWLITVVKPLKQELVCEVETKIAEFTRNDEWATMHDMDSKIVAQDNRSALYSGFMPSEVVGKMPFAFIDDSDLESVALSHQIIMKDGEIASTVFRMKNVMNTPLYIRSQSIIVLDKWTKKPKGIMSINRVLTEEEGIFLLEQQKKKVTDHFLMENQSGDSETDNHSEAGSDQTEVYGKECTCGGDPRNTDVLCKVHMPLGKPLCEVYELRAKQIWDDFESSSLDSCSNISAGVEKRAFECLGSDENVTKKYNKLISKSVCDTDAPVSRRDVPSRYLREVPSMSLRDLLSLGLPVAATQNSINQMNTTENNTLEKVKSLPLLKNLLKKEENSLAKYKGGSEVSMGSLDSHLSDSACSNFSDPQSEHRRADMQDSFSLDSPNQANSEENVRLNSFNIANSTDVQSPTVGSSQYENVKCRFASQLLMKHVKLRETLDNQKSNLEYIRGVIQGSENNIELDISQIELHRSLMMKLMAAENHVDAHTKLLQDLEQEMSLL